MSLLNTHARTSSPTKNEQFQPMGRSPVHFGVFVGFVKRADDVQRNGRLMVWIPEFGSLPDNEDGWIGVNYCSPFAGATNINTTSQANTQQFEGTQTSYGMWFVPPDINNQVIVMFLNGDPSKGIWIGSLYQQYMNNMVPGMAADAKNWQYPGKEIPVAEYNKWDQSIIYPDRAFKPYEKTKFKGVGNQGLITDKSRGTTTSGARREAPSKVFGIITPGPAINADASPDKIRRKGGSSFIMDDGTGTEYVQLTTKSGAQIKLDETNGFVYLINRDGTAWVQMDQKGNIDIFGATNISMRAQRDFNIRADRNINIEAGQNIFMKAAKDTKETTTNFTYDVNNVPKPSTIPVWGYVGEGKGTGGNIVMQALNNWHSTTQKNAFLSVTENNMDIKIGNALNVTTVEGGQNYKSKQGVKLTTDAAVDIVASNNIRVNSLGSISVISTKGVIVCTEANIDLKAADTINVASVNNILLATTEFGVTAAAKFSSTVGIKGLLTADGTSNILAKYASISENLGAITSFTATPPVDPAPANAEAALGASTAKPAEIKPLNDKINILATWKTSAIYPEWNSSTSYRAGTVVKYDNILYTANKETPATSTFNKSHWDVYIPEEKFKRDAESVQTTMSRFPTYEPCPEHDTFSATSISGAKPILTPDDNTYPGSSGAGNAQTASPPPSVNPGSSNTSVEGDPPTDTSVTKDINMNAFRGQLIIHEGLKNTIYADSVGLATGGIGHLLRENEKSQYPLGTPISDSQVEAWYVHDSTSAIKIAQGLVSDTWGNLSDVRKRAVADLAFNLGKGGLSKFKKFLSAMKEEKYEDAGRELASSAWFGQVGKRGPNIIAMIVRNSDPTGSDKKWPA